MPHLLGQMAKHISSRTTGTGDSPMERMILDTRDSSRKGLMEFQTMWMQLLFGRAMVKYIFSKGKIIGDLTQRKDHPSLPVIRGISRCSKYILISFQFNISFRPISNWEGIPDHVDDAVQYDNGYTYFFKRGEYYRFNDRYFRVGSGSGSTSYKYYRCLG